MQQQPKNIKARRKALVPKQEQQTSSMKSDVLGGMINMECRQILRKNLRLQQQIRNMHGRHEPIQIKPNFNFREQWENILYEKDQNAFVELIQIENIASYIYTAVVLTINLALFWYLSMHHIDDVSQKMKGDIIIAIGFIATIVDVLAKIYFQYLRNATRNIRITKLVKKFKAEAYLFLYLVMNLVVDFEYSRGGVSALYVFDIVAVYIVYTRAKNLFHLFKIRSYTSSQKHKMKLLDLLGTLLFFLHIFALLLYTVSFADSERNWTHKLDNYQLTGLQRYFYAFYFASTTMLTIGYGDISPTNELEILTILPIQVIGVAVFSYIISEIGYTVNSSRKEQAELQHNLSTLSKMSKLYNIDSEISNNAKDNLLSNQKSFNNVYPEDENLVLSKLNDDIRESNYNSYSEMTFNNGLSVVKSSIFFLCHWTKQFQSDIAKNLVKKILHPNQVLHQEITNQKLFIVKNGKLQIYTNCADNYKQQFKRLLKTISPKVSQEVSDNLYGYTSIVSNRPVRLLATSKDFTTVYEISKKTFMSCVNNNKLDWQYYHEMKSKIDTAQCPQSYQTPAVLSIRFHYRPSEFYIIKKHLSKMIKGINKRQQVKRSSKRRSLVYMCLYQFKSQNERTNKSIQIKKIKSQQKRSKSSDSEITEESFDKKSLVEGQFEAIKEYQNFFIKYNFKNILTKYQLSNYKNQKIKEKSMPAMFFSLLNLQQSQQSI